MSWAAAATAGGTVLSSGLGIMSGNKAARKARIATEQANAYLAEEQDKNVARFAPYTESGWNANNAMNAMMGLPQVAQPDDPNDPLDRYDWDEGTTGDSIMRFRQGDDVRTMPTLHGNQFDTDNDFWNEFITGSGYQDFYEKYGKDATADEARLGYQEWYGRRGKSKHIGFGMSQIAQGVGKFDEWAEMNKTLPEEDLNAPGADIYQWKEDPGYQFRLEEGQKELDRQAAAHGSSLSGKSMKGAMEYSQNYASAEFDKIFNRLSGIAGYGMTAATGSNNKFAEQTAGNMTNLGATLASNEIAKGNMWGDALESGAALLGDYMSRKGSGANADGGFWEGNNSPGVNNLASNTPGGFGTDRSVLDYPDPWDED